MRFLFILAAFFGVSMSLLAQRTCACPDGRNVEIGLVLYGQHGDRRSVVKIEVDRVIPSHPCKSVWIRPTEIQVSGTPYHFRLERIQLPERELDGCSEALANFVKRDKTYRFVFDADSRSIREMRAAEGPLEAAQPDPQSESNANLWTAIAGEMNLDSRRRPSRESGYFDPAREFNRTSWVLARKEVRGHYVGVLDANGTGGRLVPLKKTCRIAEGEAGQIEAVAAGVAIVRFYKGSRADLFGGRKSALRRWYEDTGGPYKESPDDLFTAIRADIVEVSLDDLIEINDYLDRQHRDRT